MSRELGRDHGERRTVTVLLVEDNEMNRAWVCRRLGRRGYSVVTAADGADGVRIAGDELPDIILMDMSLPVLDGWEATRRLKSSVRTRRIPIIALTAHATASDRERCMRAGCDDFEPKPLEFQRLIGKIDVLVGWNRLACAH